MANGNMTVHMQLQRKLVVHAHLVFDTGWRIGSGEQGGRASDLGVLLDAVGNPMLPGSSIKGKLRSTCESLASALGLQACFLNRDASGVTCVGDVKYFSQQADRYQNVARNGVTQQMDWIDKNTCDICKLFGSPIRAARLRCTDGTLLEAASAVVHVRDGVVLDRDSHTAVDGLKYDYETVSSGTRFAITFDLENTSEKEEALFGAALFEWSAGSSLGGFTSRGLGRFHLDSISVKGVDFGNPQERIQYLTTVSFADKLTDRGDWQQYFQTRINNVLQQMG